MRVLEALGSKSKLITDYENIVNYDFFNQENIFIINSTEIVIYNFFINSPYIDIDFEVLKKYTVSAWVDDIFFNEPAPENFLHRYK